MALTLVVVVGIGVFYVTLYPIHTDKSPLIKDLMLLWQELYPQLSDSILEAERVKRDAAAQTTPAAAAATSTGLTV